METLRASNAICKAIEAALQIPIYFVLGNHDFYHGSFSTTRDQVTDLVGRWRHLVYLPTAGIVELTPSSCLLGHDSWADGRLGDYAHSHVMLSDYVYIEELTGLDQNTLLERLHELGDEAAEYLLETLPKALQSYRHVVVVTHVPPFREACWHQGQVSDDEWLPHFSCKAVGEALKAEAGAWPDRQVTVLCGHTHSPGEAHILENLRVLTADAEYGEPIVQRVFEFE